MGRSPHNLATRIEPIAAALTHDAASLQWIDVDLSSAPNPEVSPTFEANYDAEGALLVAAIGQVLEAFAGRFGRVVVALDAPLEARYRTGQMVRPRVNRPGETAGLELRDGELAINAAKKRMRGVGAGWHRDLKIQPGSPIPPRVDRIVDGLEQLGFELYHGGRASDERQLIEVFPSEAIWALGLSGCYGTATSESVRLYKSRGWKELPADLAQAHAARPLLGFSALFADQLPENPATAAVPRWVERIAAHATFCALDTQRNVVRQNRRFDNLVDTGIAFLTAVAFAQGCAHTWGEGEDGAIVGPGALRGSG
ncbi:MAG: hypothetical protein HC897_19025 [Thermoanaerobaculia bacterium]|nr:hypothetical protein [Thermoanaerobaculia bacterium]